jgi:hypothetical protein
MTSPRFFHSGAAALVLAATALLSACGGGSSRSNDNNPPPAATSEVPASASQSVAGFIDYLKRLVAAAPDGLEPVNTSMVIAPTDETSEPAQVD